MTPLTFGLVAASRKGDLLSAFGKLADWMKEHAGLVLESRAAASYGELAKSVREGTSDIAWLPPVPYAWLAEAVTPLGSIVRGGATTYGSALVVRASSNVESIGDLDHARAGWVDPWSAAGYVVPRLELVRQRVELPKAFASETFYGSHRDALLALKAEQCDVIGTYARSKVDGAWTSVEDLKVRVIATFGSIPTDVIVVRRNLGPKEHELAAEAFRDACKKDDARALVRAVFDGDELREGLGTGHDALRRAYESGVASGLFD